MRSPTRARAADRLGPQPRHGLRGVLAIVLVLRADRPRARRPSASPPAHAENTSSPPGMRSPSGRRCATTRPSAGSNAAASRASTSRYRRAARGACVSTKLRASAGAFAKRCGSVSCSASSRPSCVRELGGERHRQRRLVPRPSARARSTIAARRALRSAARASRSMRSRAARARRTWSTPPRPACRVVLRLRFAFGRRLSLGARPDRRARTERGHARDRHQCVEIGSSVVPPH